ncbi:type III secretion system export apparatus subunit SctS [Paraherbaspirillum soli]|uniref:Type III secretion system export apparatus subunit SctS n=1 Tax=Paraherbaspirillum soli TaxID=631222 RepID=A0ABW0M8Q2_9BURK
MPDTLNYFQQGLWLVIAMSAPPLIVATLFGCLISIIQAITQIQDQTLPYIVKLISVAVTLALMGRWLGSEIIQLTDTGLSLVSTIGR